MHGFYETNTAHLKDLERKREQRRVQGQSKDSPRTVLATNPTNERNEQDEPPAAFGDYFYTAYEARYKTKPSPPATAFIHLSKRIKSGLSLKEWEGRVDAYFKSSFPPQKDLLGLVTTHWDRHPPTVKYGTGSPGLAV